jgi:N-methylhydantoinase B
LHSRYRGGDGVVRELEALAPLRYSLITERRRHSPPGAAGGSPGKPRRNLHTFASEPLA